jgi:hypothetical protein
MKYCIDSSGLLDGWRRYYPPDILPDLPELLEALVVDGRLLIPEEVVRELKKKDDELTAWVKKNKAAVVPLDGDIQEAVTHILGKFMRLVDTRAGRSGGDPFLIATAQVRGAMVITGEDFSNNLQKPRIPDVCQAIDVPCGKFIDIIRIEKWVFGAKRS